ncbi:GTPase-activating protein gyp8 [Massospora cicadina]|nr:GTPase-activating protein gyp8 [Massospora cicadina]
MSFKFSPCLPDGAYSQALNFRAILLKSYNKPGPKPKTHTHPDEAQVDLDIIRSLNTYPRGLSESSKEAKRSQLSKLIKRVLRSEPQLGYFQGCTRVAASFSVLYKGDAMQSNLEPAMQQLDLIFVLLRLADEELYRFLQDCEVPPYYALSWVLTWGTHDVMELELAARLVEYMLATHPCMAVYIAAALTLHFRAEIISLEPDYALVHTSLSKLFSKIELSCAPEMGNAGALDVESLFEKANTLHQRYPLTRLKRASSMAWLHPK